LRLEAHLADAIVPLERERPCPGELWRHDNVRVIVTSVTRDIITFSEGRSGGNGLTRETLPISVKTTESGGPRGYDAGKKVKGRKRHAARS